MAKSYNRSGSRRAGDDYQDLLAAEVLVEWLERPDLYEWVELEAKGAGALDDIVALRSDGSCMYIQAKFTVDPDKYPVDLAYLTGGVDKTPLLQSWYATLKKIQKLGANFTALLRTNRSAAPQIAAWMSAERPGFIDPTLIGPKELGLLAGVLGGEDSVDEFFQNFRFCLSEPDPSSLEDGLERRLLRLGGTPEGWQRLMRDIRKWAKFKDKPSSDGKITLQQIRQAALWRQPVRLAQEFPIPDDYVPPPDRFQKPLLDSKRTNPVVLWGEPGVGKSTFIGHLVGTLEKQGRPVIRHHYYLAQCRGERHERKSVSDSLLSNLLDLFKDKLPGSSENPDPSKLGDHLAQCGALCKKQKVNLVLALDGLDHVERDSESLQEVKSLLKQILPLPDGVQLLIGTQKTRAIQKMFEQLDEHEWEWIQLPRLDRDGVSTWLSHHCTELGYSCDDESTRAKHATLTVAFHKISDGLPLHLRYSFQELRQRGEPITEAAVCGLTSIAHGDIKGYYKRLWGALNPPAQSLLHLFAATPFSWKLSDLCACVCRDFGRLAEVKDSIQSILHLLDGATADGDYKMFHSSLREFIVGLPDHTQGKDLMLTSALSWLRTRPAKCHKRWANEWLIAKELGDSQPLINGPSSEWLEEALALGHSAPEAVEILQAAVAEALRAGDLAKVVYLGYLESYARGHHDHYDELYASLTYVRLAIGDEQLRSRILCELDRWTPRQICSAAVDGVRRSGNPRPASSALDYLNTRWALDRKYGGGRYQLSWHDMFVIHVKLMVAAKRLCGQSLLNRVRALKNSYGPPEEKALDYLDTVCEIIVEARALGEALKIATVDLSPNESKVAGPHIARLLLLEHATDETKALSAHINIPTVRFLLCPNEHQKVDTLVPPDLEVFNQIGEAVFGPQTRMVQEIRDYFFWSALQSRLHTPGKLHVTVKDLWLRGFLEKLQAVAAAWGRSTKLAHKDYTSLFKEFSKFSFPPRNGWRDPYPWYCKRALHEVGLDLALVNRKTQLSTVDLAHVRKVWDTTLLMRSLADYGVLSVESCAYTELRRAAIDRARDDTEGMHDWGSNLVPVALFSAQNGDLKGAEDLCLDLARKLLGHGHRKDSSLYGGLEVVELGFEQSLLGHEEWLDSLEPMFYNILEFTDGKGTTGFPKAYSRFLAAHAPQRFPAYYKFLQSSAGSQFAYDALEEFSGASDFQDSRVEQAATDLLGASGLKRLKAMARDRADDASERTQSSQSSVVKGRTASDFPPDRLSDFLAPNPTEVGWRNSDDELKRWAEHWRVTHPAETLDALEAQFQGSTYPSPLWDVMFELHLKLHGKTSAWPFLLRAHINNWAWVKGMSKREEQQARWERVRTLYPERWLEFVQATLKPNPGIPYSAIEGYSTAVCLLRYLWLLGQKELATTVAAEIVRAVRERGRGLNLKGNVIQLEPMSC